MVWEPVKLPLVFAVISTNQFDFEVGAMGYNRRSEDLNRERSAHNSDISEIHEFTRKKKPKYSHYFPKEEERDYPIRDDDVDFLCRNIRC